MPLIDVSSDSRTQCLVINSPTRNSVSSRHSADGKARSTSATFQPVDFLFFFFGGAYQESKQPASLSFGSTLVGIRRLILTKTLVKKPKTGVITIKHNAYFDWDHASARKCTLRTECGAPRFALSLSL